MFCPNCKKELPEGTRFCGGCGTRVEVVVEQPAAQPVQQPVQFTEVVFDAPVQPAQPEAKAAKPNVLDTLKAQLKKIPAKYLKLGGIVAAVLVVAIVLVCVFAGGSGSKGGSGQPDGALYLKDGELYYSDYSKKDPLEITGNLLDNASSSTLRGYAYELASTIHVTADGETMFFMDKLDYYGTGTLYYRSLTNFKDEAVKIAAGVSQYTVSDDGKIVTYLKNETLYQFDMKEEVKLEKDVSNYRVSSDGKIIYYRNYDGAWYVLKNGEDEKIGTDISIEYITEDFSTVYYMNDGKLYKKTIGKDKEKLLSDVYDISEINEDGTFYYTVYAEIPLSDFFEEDTNEYDGLMETLEEEVMEFYEIGYFDGKKGNVIGENCTNMDGAYYDGGMMMFYSQYDLSGITPITLTELVEYYYDSYHYYVGSAAQAMVQSQMADTCVNYVAINGTTSVLDVEDVYDITVSNDGSTMFILADVDFGSDGVEAAPSEGPASEETYKEPTNAGTLYKVTIAKDSVKSVDEFDSDVYYDSGLYFASYYGSDYSDYFVYYKDVEDNVGDLYVNGTEVDSDVYVYRTVRYEPQSKGLVYYTEYDSYEGIGILKLWNGKESVEIYDEVYEYSITDSGDILVGYDEDDGAFTLAVWDGKNLTEITDDAYTVSELENGDVLVGTDYSSRSDSFTLNLWDGKKLNEISEDVYDYTVMFNGDILYLYDYSTSKYEGELYRWNGKKAELVDEDVAAVIHLPGTSTHYFDN